MTWPQTVIDLRSRLGVSQERLAYLLNIATRTVYRWESGAAEPAGDTRAATLRHFAALKVAATRSDRVAIEQAAAEIAERVDLAVAEILDRIYRPRITSTDGDFPPIRAAILNHYGVETPDDITSADLKKLSTVSGVSERTIRRILSKPHSKPQVDTAVHISTALVALAP